MNRVICTAVAAVGAFMVAACSGESLTSMEESQRADGADLAAGLVASSPLSGQVTLGGSGKQVLIYGPSMFPDPPNEQSIAESQGHTVTVADETTWSSMTTSDFAAFDAIVFGDPGECLSGTDHLATAEANKEVWSAAISGAVVVNGTDPIYHILFADEEGLAATLLTRGSINFAVSGTGTGLYATLSCYYGRVTSPTTVDFLTEVGTFVVREQGGGPCPNNVNVLRPDHLALGGQTDFTLSNWDCSMHEWFDRYPRRFLVLATVRAEGHYRPYILATRH